MRVMRLILMLLALASVPAAAQTECGGEALPYSETFDGTAVGEIPACWAASRNYDLGPLPAVDTTQRHSGHASLMLYSGSLPSSHYSIAIGPELAVADFDGLYLRLRYFASSTATRLEVGICQDTGRYTRQFTPLDTLRAVHPGQWNEAVVDLGRYTGSGRRLALRMQRSMQGAASRCYVDDLRVEPCGTTQPTVSHLGARTLTLDWEAYGVGTVNLQYSGITVTGATPPLTITGLTPSTTYTFSVGCAGGEQQHTTVTTLPGPSLTTTWYEPFDTASLALACGDSTLYILPLQEALASRDLNMALHLRADSGGQLTVGVMDFPGEPSTFQAVDSATGTQRWQRLHFSLAPYSGSGGYLALKATGAGTVWVESLRVARCLIDDVRLYGLTENAVTIGWDTLLPAGGSPVNLEYGPLGFTPGTGTTVAATSNPFTLSGLQPSTRYDLYVAPACGDVPCAYDLHHFSTFAHSVQAPYCTLFGNESLPLGWVNPQGEARQRAQTLVLDSGALATLPLVTVGPNDTLWLEFSGRGTGRLVVGTLATPYSDFAAVDSCSGNATARHVMPITVPTGHLVGLRTSGAWTLDHLMLHRDAIGPVTVSAISQNSARVAWSMLHGDSVWIEYKAVPTATSDFIPGTGIAVRGLDSVVLHSLVPSTYYALHLMPTSDTAEACRWITTHLLTATAPMAAPYCENFDAQVNNGYPSAWRRTSTAGNYPIVSTTRSRSASKSLLFRAGARGHTIGLLPDIASTSAHLTLAFWTHPTRMPSGTRMVVGQMDDLTDMGTFTPIDTLTLGTLNAWKHHVVDLGTRHSHVVLMLVGGSSDTRVFIDDLCVEPCAAYNIKLTNIDSTEVTLSWQSIGMAGLEVTVSGTGPTRVDTLYTSPAVVDNLMPDQYYKFTFRSLCECGTLGGAYRLGYGSHGDISTDQETTIEINTHPPIIYPPFCQSFDSYTPGHFMRFWRRHGGSAAVSDLQHHSGSRSLKVANAQTIVLPPVEQLQDLTLSFYAYATNDEALGNGALVVGAMRDPDTLSTFVPIDTLHLSHPGEWQRLSTSLQRHSLGYHYLALRFAPSDTSTLYIDNLNLSACNLGTTSVHASGLVEWVPLNAPTAVAVEYGLRGFALGSGTSDTVRGSSTYTLANLTPGDNYDIYLTAVCGTVANCIPVKLSLSSLTATPYCEHFETAPTTGLPEDWTMGRTYSGTPIVATATGNRHLLLKSHANGDNSSLAILPALTDTGDSLQLSLSLRSANHANARLVVGYVNAEGDPNTFVATDTLGNSTSNTWQRTFTLLASPAGRRLALGCLSLNQGAEIRVDSLAVTRGMSPAITATSARTAWLRMASADTYIEYGTAGFIQGSGTLIHITSRHHSVEGLTPGQQYWFYTRDDSASHSCMPPLVLTMPIEVPLPYCHDSTALGHLLLPEMDIDSTKRLHLYLDLQGSVEVGVMEHAGDWDHLVVLDTATSPIGTRRTVYASLEAYRGDGRFVGLRAIDGNATLYALTVSECPWPTATLRDDNSIAVVGNGYLEYGPAGFTPGNGTRVHIVDSLTITGLADTSVYDYYSWCTSGAQPCQAPRQWHTTLAVDLPYCADFADGMATGWIPFSDAATGPAVRIADSCLILTVSGDQQVGAQLPTLPGGRMVIDMEVLFSSTAVALVVEGTTLRVPAGVWNTVRVITESAARPSIRATGNGTIKIRRVEVSACTLPMTVSARQPGGGLVVLDWDSNETDSLFYIEYRLKGEPMGTTVRSETPPMTLNLLPDTAYTIYIKCDSAETTCRQPLAINTLITPYALPYCTDTIPKGSGGWVQVAGNNGYQYLILPPFDIDSLRRLNMMFYAQATGSNREVTIGAVSDIGDLATFDSLANFSISRRALYFHTFDTYYGDGLFLALRLNGPINIDNLSVSSCAAYGVYMAETEAEHLTVAWQQQGSPQVNIEYGPTGFTRGTGNVVVATESPCRIGGLDPLTDYTVYVSTTCPGLPCRPIQTDTFYTFTPKGGVGCIDYTDLHASYVTCRYGTFNNPSESLGVVDHGHLNAASRHTVHSDTTERDPRTGGLLRTIPTGNTASVRLGNWASSGDNNAEAESITYGLTVDPSQFDLLILKYAAVLQDPEHSADLQPRFRMEILDQNDNLIDSCGMAFFIANPNLNWNMAPNEVLWKDWTTVGVDLSNYANQTIFIRLTTNDCGEGSHFGYAYFTLECATKRMQTEGCSDVPNNRFTAPNGFNYRWFSNQDASTLSDSASIWVRSDNSMIYYCELSFIDNPQCTFTMSAFAGARYPLALFDTVLTAADCMLDLELTNRSTISADGHTPIGTGEGCESTLWILPDSTTSNAQSLTLHLTDTGTYSITLIAGIANDQCIDTLQQNIHISYPYPNASIEGRSLRCDNDMADTLRIQNATHYEWDGGGTEAMVITPTTDTTVTCYAVNLNGCHDTVSHTIGVRSTYAIETFDTACNSASQYLWIDTLIEVDLTEGTLIRSRPLVTTDGCDSVHSLNLVLQPAHYIDHYDTLCHDSKLHFFDTVLTTTGNYLHRDSTVFGCDSMVTMHLQIVPRVYSGDPHEVCDSLTWIDGNTYHTSTQSVRDTLATVRGCDSVVTLLLTVHPSYRMVEPDTFCHGTTYMFRGCEYNTEGYYADTLASVYGCDSVLGVELTQLSIPTITFSNYADCDSVYHHITATSDVPYLQWDAYPYDNTLDGQEHRSSIDVKPTTTTTYTLYADYAEQPHCPTTATITLSPASKPDVVLKVNPGALRPMHREFDAYDLSKDYQERAWYIDGILQSETSRHLHASAADGADSALVQLVVSDGRCIDTATAILPVLYNDIIAPNVFTPDADINNRFFIVSRGFNTVEIDIYNRYGTLMFHSTDPNGQWDGHNIDGYACPTGNYVWHIRYSTLLQPNTFFTATGSVLLLR